MNILKAIKYNFLVSYPYISSTQVTHFTPTNAQNRQNHNNVTSADACFWPLRPISRDCTVAYSKLSNFLLSPACSRTAVNSSMCFILDGFMRSNWSSLWFECVPTGCSTYPYTINYIHSNFKLVPFSEYWSSY